MEQRYQCPWNEAMHGDYCWFVSKDGPELAYKRKRIYIYYDIHYGTKVLGQFDITDFTFRMYPNVYFNYILKLVLCLNKYL